MGEVDHVSQKIVQYGVIVRAVLSMLDLVRDRKGRL
jgi:hypothetical protein